MKYMHFPMLISIEENIKIHNKISEIFIVSVKPMLYQHLYFSLHFIIPQYKVQEININCNSAIE